MLGKRRGCFQARQDGSRRRSRGVDTAGSDRGSDVGTPNPGEFEVIAALQARFEAAAGRPSPPGEIWIGDDAAVVADSGGAALLLATDLVVAGVHADLDLCTVADLGFKAVMVTVSDLAAMGGRPDHLLVSVAAPPGTDLEELGSGVAEAATATGCVVVGGDLSTAPAVVVSVAAIGSLPLIAVIPTSSVGMGTSSGEEASSGQAISRITGGNKQASGAIESGAIDKSRASVTTSGVGPSVAASGAGQHSGVLTRSACEPRRHPVRDRAARFIGGRAPHPAGRNKGGRPRNGRPRNSRRRNSRRRNSGPRNSGGEGRNRGGRGRVTGGQRHRRRSQPENLSRLSKLGARPSPVTQPVPSTPPWYRPTDDRWPDWPKENRPESRVPRRPSTSPTAWPPTFVIWLTPRGLASRSTMCPWPWGRRMRRRWAVVRTTS